MFSSELFTLLMDVVVLKKKNYVVPEHIIMMV